MATKEIKQRIQLQGEREYNQAIKDATRNINTLKSELKAETAEMGKNATEQQKAEARAKALKKEIAEQEKIVKTLRDALEQAKKEYGDNDDVVQKWEQRLNGARTTLANMRGELEDVGQSFGKAGTNAAQATVATKSAADALEKVASVGDSVAGSIENIFTGMIETVTGMVEQLWGLITETAAKANNWTDLAGYYGSTAQAMQMWSNSIEAAGGSFGKFQGIIQRLAFGGKEDKITELLGIDKGEYQDDVEYTLAVLDELEKRKNALGQGWYDETMNQIFGAKKSADVSWFLANAHGHEDANGNWVNGWRDNPERFNGNESGYGMSDEELSTMNDVWVRMNEIEERWDALKRNFGSSFGKITLDLMVNVEGTLDGIAEYLNATDDSGKQAALDKIRKNVEEFFTKLGEIIRDSIHIIKDVGLSLKESDDPLTSAIGDILVKLSGALEWMVNNAEDVKAAFDTIFGVWLIARLAAVAGKLSSILSQIEVIKQFKGLQLAGAGAGAAGAGAGAAGAGAGAAEGAAAGSVAGGMATAAAGALGLYVIGKGFEWAADKRTNHREKVIGTDENLEKSTGGSDELKTIFSEWAGVREQLENLDVTATEEEVVTLQERSDALWAQLNQMEGFQDLWNSYEAWRQERGMNSTDWSLPDWFTPEPEEIEEFIDLEEDERPEYTDEERESAVQDWWDAWRNAANGEDSWDEADKALEWLQEVFGDEWGEIYERILARLDETENQNGLEDIPADWWMSAGTWDGSGEGGSTRGRGRSGYTIDTTDVAQAAKDGVINGMKGIGVYLDGQKVGTMVAPRVSEELAGEVYEYVP